MLKRMEHYDSGKIYAARRAVTINGVEYKPGELVPRDAARDEFTYRKWFENRLLAAPVEDAPVIAAPATQTFQASDEYQPVPKGMITVEVTVHGNGDASPPAANGGTNPALHANEGYIEPNGRGWFTVHFRNEKPEKVRGALLASQTLDKFRENAGLAPLSESKDAPAGEAAPQDGDGTGTAPAASGDDAPWDDSPAEQADGAQLGDFAHTGGETDELPDEDAPSAPYVPGGEVSAEAHANG
jgi:hypothetical protein